MPEYKPFAARPVLIAAGAVSLTLGMLTTLLALGYFRQIELREAARREGTAAIEAAQQAQDASNRGLRARDEAEHLVGFILEDLSDSLEEIGRTDLLQAAAAQAADYFDSLPPELVTDDSRNQHAAILLTYSQTLYQQGKYDEAIAAVNRAIRLWEELAAEGDPDGTRTIAVGRALGELALYQNQSGDHESARATNLKAIKSYENPPPNAPDDGWWDHGRAKAQLGLGEVERLLENHATARTAYAQAVDSITVALAKRPEEISFIRTLMTAHNNTGVTFMHDKRYEEAEVSLLKAIDANRVLIRLEPKYRRWEKELGTSLLNLGALLHLRHNDARAEPFLQEALKLRKGLAEWDPKNTRLVRQLAHAWHRIATFQFDTGAPSKGLESARQALAAQKRLLTIDPGNRSAIGELEDYAQRYSELLSEAGQQAAALSLVQEAASFAEANLPDGPGADAWEQLLAGLYTHLERAGGKPDTSALLRSRRRAVDRAARALDDKPTDVGRLFTWAEACVQLGRAYQESGFTGSALNCLRLGRRILRDHVPSDVPGRDLRLDQAERLEIQAARELGRIAPPQVLVPSGAQWRYFDQDSAPGRDWNSIAFDDRKWPQGAAPLGYGESDIVTRLNPGPDNREKRITSWFRREVAIPDPSTIDTLRFSLRRDDGAVVYLNGVELFRDAIGPGPVTPSTTAQMTRGDEEIIPRLHRISAASLPLRAGQNVISVEVHQNEPASSDLAFDLEVWTNFTTPDPASALDEAELRDALGPGLPQTVRLILGLSDSAR